MKSNEMNEMEFSDAELEAALAKSLAAVEAPAGFAERVLARAATEDRAPQPAKILRFPPRLASSLRVLPAMGAIAAGLLVAAFTGYDLHQRHEGNARRAAQATQQFDLATEITDRTLAQAQEHAQEQAREQIRRAGLEPNALQ